MLGNLQAHQIEDVLKNQLVGRIGCSLNGETYIVPISYAYDGDYIYCHTSEGKKTAIMRNNPKVCFQVDEMKDRHDKERRNLWQQVKKLENILTIKNSQIKNLKESKN
jgi:nitroimidazol reductase NimA-like FMN-containing flavoprotein (pyridoxamine 5'-phosphate oxidase superfamily)